MTALLILSLTHSVAVFVDFIIGIAIARWAITPQHNPDRYWNGK
jgi:hypothetical protein